MHFLRKCRAILGQEKRVKPDIQLLNPEISRGEKTRTSDSWSPRPVL